MLTGTEEFLPLPLLCLQHRSGDRLLRTRLSANKRRLLPSARSSYLKRKLPQGSRDQVGRWSPPQPLASTLRWHACAPRATLAAHAQSQGCLFAEMAVGNGLIPAYIAPGCVLDTICLLLPIHSLFHGVMGDWSSFPRSPLLALPATWQQTRGGGAPAGSPPEHWSTQHPQQGEGRRAPPSWLLPSRPSLARMGKIHQPNKEKAKRECALTRKHTGQTLLAQKVLHMLRKQENAMETQERTTESRWCSYCFEPNVFSCFSVGWADAVSSIRKASRKVGCVFLSPHELL